VLIAHDPGLGTVYARSPPGERERTFGLLSASVKLSVDEFLAGGRGFDSDLVPLLRERYNVPDVNLVKLREIYLASRATEAPSNATPFGFLSSEPLQRSPKILPAGIYAKFAAAGAVGCAVTHSLVTPLDVVKTRCQADPGR
jgi:hypothetical protein